MDVYKNGEVICKTTPTYSNSTSGQGGTGEHTKRQMGPPIIGGDYSNTDIAHISRQDGCIFDPPMRLIQGDVLHIKSEFDFNLHPGMKNAKGELDAVMGMVGALIAFE